MGPAALRMRQAAEIVQRLPVYELGYPRDYGMIDKVNAAILKTPFRNLHPNRRMRSGMGRPTGYSVISVRSMITCEPRMPLIMQHSARPSHRAAMSSASGPNGDIFSHCLHVAGPGSTVLAGPGFHPGFPMTHPR